MKPFLSDKFTRNEIQNQVVKLHSHEVEVKGIIQRFTKIRRQHIGPTAKDGPGETSKDDMNVIKIQTAR
jgi:hypothetical protein